MKELVIQLNARKWITKNQFVTMDMNIEIQKKLIATGFLFLKWEDAANGKINYF